MKKITVLLLICLSVTACGKKGPLIVEQPITLNNQQVDDEQEDGLNNNETGTRLSNAIDGKPIIIYR